MVKSVDSMDYKWSWDESQKVYVVYYKPYKIAATGKTLKLAEKAILKSISLYKKETTKEDNG